MHAFNLVLRTGRGQWVLIAPNSKCFGSPIISAWIQILADRGSRNVRNLSCTMANMLSCSVYIQATRFGLCIKNRRTFRLFAHLSATTNVKYSCMTKPRCSYKCRPSNVASTVACISKRSATQIWRRRFAYLGANFVCKLQAPIHHHCASTSMLVNGVH